MKTQSVAKTFNNPGGKAGKSETKKSSARQEGFPIIVYSHLRWDSVWQRPQQFLSRLSQRHPVLFIEEPHQSEEVTRPSIEHRYCGLSKVQIVRPILPSTCFKSRSALEECLRLSVESFLSGPAGRSFKNPVHWFYDPMAHNIFPDSESGQALVYDCMDQLSQFRGAPVELVEREAKLLSRADVVFTGGPKIQSAKAPNNSNCHCFGCGVDTGHFGKSMKDETLVPDDILSLKGPILGFFGVVDERMDYSLIDFLARAKPEWNLVILGPSAKVNPANFPRHPNIHWMGSRDYRDLPNYAKAFDVCLMPFALNEATEYINPTKALEYMATGTPVVSTAVEDVVKQFSDVVSIAGSHEDFLFCCREAIESPDRRKIEAGLRRAFNNTWENIVDRMENLIRKAIVIKSEAAE